MKNYVVIDGMLLKKKSDTFDLILSCIGIIFGIAALVVMLISQ